MAASAPTVGRVESMAERAQVLGDAACRRGIEVLRTRLMGMVGDLAAAEMGAIELSERMGRVGHASTIVASQAESDEWYLQVKSGNSADAISNSTRGGVIRIVIRRPGMRRYLASGEPAQ